MKRVLVTGANGFIGSALCSRLLADGLQFRTAVRKDHSSFVEERGSGSVFSIGDVGPDTDWSRALECIDIVVHTAARAHRLDETSAEMISDYRKVNTAGTEHLAKMSIQAGVRRMVFISTVKVSGEGSPSAYTEEDPLPDPQGAYEVSKWEAEQALRESGIASNLEVVILRPPLVYGPGVKANFLSLLKAISMGIPLPLAGIRNRRSFIYIGNLIEAILLSMHHENASGETFVVSDGRDVSTPDLIRIIASAMRKKPLLFPVHPYLLNGLGLLAGKQGEMERLTSSLFVDCSKICRLLGWRPPFSMEEGMRHTVQWFSQYEENI
jgi:nucleoside-diphosphate-sugar epimerase